MTNIKKGTFKAILLAVVIAGIYSFKPSSDKLRSAELQSTKSILKDSLFNAYWYDDKAEIRTYKLTQARYGELHQGMATVIFVTEPFLKKKGVKPDNFKNTSDQIPVLKMNLLKKFGTGIYPYSMMLSSYTPLNEAQGINKVVATGQEWCGQIFSQINQRNDHYDVVSYSYFEQEGDRKFTLPIVYTEDEIWSRIRIDYKSLPQGDFEIIPGLYYTRLEQFELKAEKANATLKVAKETSIYTLSYPKRKRTLSITFNTAFPYEIIKWEETYADRRAPNNKLTTTAILDQSKNIDYWNYSAEKYKSLRKELGVPY